MDANNLAVAEISALHKQLCKIIDQRAAEWPEMGLDGDQSIAAVLSVAAMVASTVLVTAALRMPRPRVYLEQALTQFTGQVASRALELFDELTLGAAQHQARLQ